MSLWAQRRAAVAAEAQADADATAAAEVAAFEAAQAERSDAEILEDLGLPDPDTLEPGMDIKAFMQSAVPQRIKTRALRRLWRVNPVLANLDGLVDYDDDYTDAALVVDGMKTAYQVGKGMLKHIEAMATEAEAASKPPTAAEEAPREALADAADDDAPTLDQSPDIAPIIYVAQDDAATDDAAPEAPITRRRMTFTFEETPT